MQGVGEKHRGRHLGTCSGFNSQARLWQAWPAPSPAHTEDLSYPLTIPPGAPSAPARMHCCPPGTGMAGVPQPVPLRSWLGPIPAAEPGDPDSPSLASPLRERTLEMRTPPSSIRPGPHFTPLRESRQGPPLPWRFSCAPCPPGSFPHVSHPVPASRIAGLGGHMGFVKRRKGIAWSQPRRPDLQ